MAEDLNLAERRALADYQQKTYPALAADIAATAADVPIEVEWTQIAIPGEADHYSDDDFWTNVYFKPLITALKSVAADEMGKQAVKAKLNKIVVTYNQETAPATAYEKGVKFDGGVLTINFTPYSNASDVQARADAIRKTLEANL